MVDFNYLFKENVTDNTMVKALRVYNNCTIIHKSSADGFNKFECQNETYKDEFYKVKIIIKDNEVIETYCTCPVNDFDYYCKHVTACLLYLKNKLGLPNETNHQIVNNNEKPNSLPGLDIPVQIYSLTYLSELKIFEFMSQIYKGKIQNYPVKIISEIDKTITAEVEVKKNIFKVSTSKINQYIECRCSCQFSGGICEHSKALLYYILKTKRNPYYFDTLRDITDEKAALLKQYGISAEDEEAAFFEFYFEGQTLKIKSINSAISSLQNWEGTKILKSLIEEIPKKKQDEIVIPKKCIFILRKFKTTPIIRFDVYPVEGVEGNISSLLTKIANTNESLLKKSCPDFAELIYTFTPIGIFEKSNGRRPAYFNVDYELMNLTISQIGQLKSLMVKLFHKNLELLSNSQNLFYKTSSITKPKPKDLEPLVFSENFFKPILIVQKLAKFISVKLLVKINEERFELTEFDNYAEILLLKNGVVYIVENAKYWQILNEFFRQPEKLFPIAEASLLFKEYLLPLRNEINMDLPEGLIPEKIIPETISFAVQLKEMEPNYLLLNPIIIYNNAQAELDGEIIEYFDGLRTVEIERVSEKEKELKNLLQNLHPKFEKQLQNDFYHVTFQEALENNWFLNTINQLNEAGVAIFGQKELLKFRYNTHTPKIDIRGGSGIDWFELKIEISYGSQLVSLKALQTAIINKQDFVKLDDGTMGLLPQDWIKKFRSILKLGNIKSETEIEVSKLHYTLIDEFYENISDADLIKELNDKKLKLKEIGNAKDLALPKNIKATLRPYQLSGYHWFNQLYNIGWGGCLADDMGLGKTLQTLCFLQGLHNKNKQLKSIIVCPTSLIYNWEAEINKFTKNLKYAIYHGFERDKDALKNKWHILITSYGTLRNDIEHFKELDFEIAILDESQSIKNPVSQTTKAVHLLKAKNRFVLSGTPVQNNTFDLYAQLNFCNPGLLGNQDFFKTEFANPIDRNGDKEKTKQLRKMVFPFILRRTKDQVAKDLPSKTETVMYCEMDTYQQKVYDAVKEEYRTRIMTKIESEGMGKAAFLILEGLNKLRLICDCPSLVKDDSKKRFNKSSIKLEELMREIEENIGNHKMLIFSQFLGMLDLIKEQLEKQHINYIYLDGSTPAKERNELVDKFQNNKTTQIFLISLKAGGVGLTLTAADYVYIVDPWWNPAVEDQAIDRTHRIGQDKKIFAYKLICKNSIEEKIMQLQEKKKTLAKELITEDASFVKKLTVEDVSWLLQ